MCLAVKKFKFIQPSVYQIIKLEINTKFFPFIGNIRSQNSSIGENVYFIHVQLAEPDKTLKQIAKLFFISFQQQNCAYNITQREKPTEI